MAKVTKMEIRRGITINLGDYQSERYDVALEITLDGEDIDETAEWYGESCNRLLALQLFHRLADGEQSIMGKLKEGNWPADQKIARLKRQPEYTWIEQLHAPTAELLIDTLRGDANPSTLMYSRTVMQDEMDSHDE